MKCAEKSRVNVLNVRSQAVLAMSSSVTCNKSETMLTSHFSISVFCFVVVVFVDENNRPT